MFLNLYDDREFLKEMANAARALVESANQKATKIKVFQKTCSSVFINILDEVGKISKISKNFPEVLGYMPH